LFSDLVYKISAIYYLSLVKLWSKIQGRFYQNGLYLGDA